MNKILEYFLIEAITHSKQFCDKDKPVFNPVVEYVE